MAFQQKIENIIKSGKQRILLVKLKSKDKNAFVEAYDKHVDEIYRFIFFKISDNEEANDLTSQVFLKTWDYIQTRGISEESSLRALLYRIARNVVIDYYRMQGRRDVVSLDAVDEYVFGSVNISNDVHVKVDYEIVMKRIHELKTEYREVLIMHFVEELTVREMAQILSKTRGNTRVLLHRAIKTYKTLINKNEQ